MATVPSVTNQLTGLNAVSNTGTANLSAVSGIVSSLLGFQGEAAQNAANATAAGLTAQGDLGEAAAYGSAYQIAQQNAILAGVSGDISELQQQRQVSQTIGAQQAGVAASGFRSAGSAISLLKSSLQQGYIGKQLIETQTGIQQGGFLEAGAASQAEQAAANTAAQSADVLGQAESTAAATATTNAANETAALTAYLKTVTPTPETQLVTDVMGGTNTPEAQTLTDLGKVAGNGRQTFTGRGWAPANTTNPSTGKPYLGTTG